MIVWLWIGGGLMAVGTVLSAFPGTRRRRPTDPVSAPIAAGSAAGTRSTTRCPLADDLLDAPAAGDGDAPTRSRRRVAPLVVGGIAVVMVALFWVLLGADPNRDRDAPTRR